MQRQRFDIVLLGAGNVAWHLGKQFLAAGHKVVQVYNRSMQRGTDLAAELNAEFTNRLGDVTKEANIYIIAATDHGIDDIILGLRLEGKIVAHTSGSVPLRGMEHISSQCGIFYPLQTLTVGRPVSFKGVPVFIEAANEEVKLQLTLLAQSIGARVEYLTSAKRKAIHIAAVYANNFTNYLMGVSKHILEREKLSFDLLLPLLAETFEKAKHNNPVDIQTGPARRGDYKTIDEHLHFLSRYEQYREVYLVLTESIISQAAGRPEEKEAVEDESEYRGDEDFDFLDEEED